MTSESGSVATPIDRPLALGELLAETVRIYTERVWAAFGLGAVVAAALTAMLAVPNDAVRVAILAAIFTVAYAAATRLAAGDRFAEAWAQAALRSPALLVLVVAVALPFALGRLDPIILFFSIFWLALTGFSIPVLMVEQDAPGDGWFARLHYAVSRSVALARTQYLHAAGVIAALVIVYIIIGDVLARALVGFADSGVLPAVVLVQVVLAPFFFLGLAVLYFEQRARAVSSRGRT